MATDIATNAWGPARSPLRRTSQPHERWGESADPRLLEFEGARDVDDDSRGRSLRIQRPKNIRTRAMRRGRVPVLETGHTEESHTASAHRDDLLHGMAQHNPSRLRY